MNTLIAYFSYTGHTKGIARQIQSLTGGDLFELRPAAPYSDDYDTTERQGRRETGDIRAMLVSATTVLRQERCQKKVDDLPGISKSYISRLEKWIIASLKREIIRLT